MRKKKSVKENPAFKKVMEEFKHGELHSGSKTGPIVSNPRQAIAIGLSEAKKAGAKIPKQRRNCREKG